MEHQQYKKRMHFLYHFKNNLTKEKVKHKALEQFSDLLRVSIIKTNFSSWPLLTRIIVRIESRSSTLHGFMAAETNNDYCGYLHTFHIRAEKVMVIWEQFMWKSVMSAEVQEMSYSRGLSAWIQNNCAHKGNQKLSFQQIHSRGES